MNEINLPTPMGCGAELTRHYSDPKIGRVDITYFCTACGTSQTVSVMWRSHHALPKGWRCRDIVPTHELPRRTDHMVFLLGGVSEGARYAISPAEDAEVVQVVMTDPALPARLAALVETMRHSRSRWPHAYGSADVVYADKVDEWADELEAVAALLVGVEPQETP